VSSRVPITRDQIVRTAAKRLAEEGLAGVSLRKIGLELGVSAPTLLWHVKSKRELMDAVASHLLSEARPDFYDRPAEGQPWWDWLEERTRWIYQAMVGLKDAPLVVAGNRPTPETLPGANTALGVMVAAGFSAGEALQVFFALGGYIGGMALEAQADAAREEHDTADEAAAELADHQHLRDAMGTFEQATPTATFDYGLGLLMRGIRARHAEITAS
jgi:TetR/AcrR family tetracycline transcriptional repressor